MVGLETTEKADRFLADVFRRQAGERGRQVALRDSHGAVTFEELDRNASRVAQSLIADGVARGDRVAIISRNCIEFFEVLAGVTRAGACLNPINFRLTAPEIDYILKDSAPAIMVVAAEFAEVAAQVVSGLSKKPDLIVLNPGTAGESTGGSAATESTVSNSIGDEAAEIREYSAWRDASNAEDPLLSPEPQDDLFLLYTSGTTGYPKGVRISNQNYQAFLSAIADVPGFAYETDATVASTMPLFHVAGINVGMAGIAQGCEVVLFLEFEPKSFLRSIEERQINYAFLAPAMIVKLLEVVDEVSADCESLKLIAYGASPIAGSVLQKAMEAFGCHFAQLYGMTESTGAGTYLPHEDHLRAEKAGSCGRAWPGMRMAVVDEAGAEVAPGEVGEIVLSGALVSPGYRNRPDATAETIRQGWLHTGDAGYADEEGHFFIRDRIKDLIITGGENVSPTEVENAIAGCPGVADVAVIGVPSEKWGEEVKAVVVPGRGQAPVESDIIAWARRSLAGFKAPKSVDFIEAIPRNAAGKVLKRELRKPYWNEQERSV